MIARMKYFVLDLIAKQRLPQDFPSYEAAEAYISTTGRPKHEFNISLQR